MAITTLDGLIAGFKPPLMILKQNGSAPVVGRLQSLYQVPGIPGNALVPLGGVAGTGLTSILGQIPFDNPTGTSKTYLANFNANCNVAGTLILCDRLWHNAGLSVTSTGVQNVNSITLPARCNSGGTEGTGVMMAVEVTANLGAGTPTYTTVYQNDKGVSGQTTVTGAQTATMLVGSFIPLPLGSGDTGVRSIQSWKLSATHTLGSVSLVLYRELARINITSAGVSYPADVLSNGMPQLYDNTCPFLLWYPATATAPFVTGLLNYTQG